MDSNAHSLAPAHALQQGHVLAATSQENALVRHDRQAVVPHNWGLRLSTLFFLAHCAGAVLFKRDGARLAERALAQLMPHVEFDQAVERGRREERQRIAQDLHDDIGARLLTLMYQAPNRDTEDYIRQTIVELKTLTRGLAAEDHQLSHAASDWKADIARRLMVAHCELDWTFTHDKDVVLNMVQWSAVTRILRELVTNAISHGHATRVSVAGQLTQGHLLLSVVDDGIGVSPAAWQHGLGMGGIRKRVAQLGGSVRWEVVDPRGIACIIDAPLDGPPI